MRLPSGLNAALITAPSWPASGSPICSPVLLFHNRAVLSTEAVTMRVASGLNAALLTGPSWPASGSPECLKILARASHTHTHTVVSSKALTMRLPSRLNATVRTRPLWTASGCPICWPVSTDHTCTLEFLFWSASLRPLVSDLASDDLSSDRVTMRVASELTTALRTPTLLSGPPSGPPIGLPVSAAHTCTVSGPIFVRVLGSVRRRFAARQSDDARVVRAETHADHDTTDTVFQRDDGTEGLAAGVPSPLLCRPLVRRGDHALAVSAWLNATPITLF